MNLDSAFVYSVLVGGQDKLSEIMTGGFRKDFLSGDARKVFDEALSYFVQYSSWPSLSMLEAKTGVKLDPVTEPAEFYAKELQGRHIAVGIQTLMADVSRQLQAQSLDPWTTLSFLAESVRKVQRELVTNTGLESLPALSRLAFEWYERIEKGERGILTPWPSINSTTLGLWPEDFILFVARSGIGKTWLSIMIAREAWKQGKKVLFVTTEMSKLAISRRFTAVELRLPYGQVTSGTLGAFQKKKWEDALVELEQDECWKIIGGDFDYQVGTIWAYVDAWEPDLVVADGLYLLKTDEKSEKKNERAASVYDEVKRGAKRFKIPVAATTQFNRTLKAGTKDPDVSAIAQTDAGGWNADCAYALTQDDEQKTNNCLFIRPMKVREGTMKDFECNWNFDAMDFTEKVQVTHQPPGTGNTSGAGNTPPIAGTPTADDPNMSLF